MNLRLIALAIALVAALHEPASALTIENEITSAYLKAHAAEFSVAVSQGEDGLIRFRIRHDVKQPMYHVAELSIYQDGKRVAQTNMPHFGRKRENLYDFSLSPETVYGSTFTLSDSALGGSGENALPIPGTIIHHFQLIDFVPEKLLPPKPAKRGSAP